LEGKLYLSVFDISTWLGEIWKILKNPQCPQWLVAVGTLFLAYVTYRLVKQEIRSGRERKNIAALEDIVKPLYLDLKKLACSLKRLSIPSHFKSEGGRAITEKYPLWNKIKQEHFYLLSNLNKEIRNELNNFPSKIKTVIYLYNQNFEQFNTILVNVLEPITGKDSYPTGVREAVYYRASIGGKNMKVFIPTLIFLNQSLEEYIDEILRDESLPNKRIEDEAFMINGLKKKELGRKNFDDIVLSVNQNISGKPDLRKFIKECEEIHREVERLIKSLEKEMERLAKR